MTALDNIRKWIPRLSNQPIIVRVLVGASCLITAAAALSAPVEANSMDDAFIGALNNAGVKYADPGGAVQMGQSICPMLARPGGTFASAASNVAGNNHGMSPAMAEMFTSIAISMYCPSMVASIANGNVPNMPALPGVPAL
jgi:Protein of unknown function (DUF732)